MPSHLVRSFPLGGDPTDTRGRLLARDGNNRLWFVHTGWNGADDDIWLSYSDDDGSTWTSNQIAAVAGFSQRGPAIAVDSFNNLHIVWDGYGWGANPARSNIQYLRRAASGVWDAQVALTDSPWNQGGATVAVDSNDNVFVTWEGAGLIGPMANEKICCQRRSATGVWGAIEYVVNMAFIQGVPSLAIDRNDIVHIVWAALGWGANPGNGNIRYARRTLAGTWGTFEAVTDVAFDQALPYLALDSEKNVHVVWEGLGWGANPGVSNIQYCQRTGAGWGAQEAVTDVAVAQNNVFVSVDLSGNVYASWEGNATPWGAVMLLILYRQRTVAGWQPVVIVPDDRTLLAYHTNVLWASHPTIGGLVKDTPELGLAIAYSQDTALVSNVYYYASPILTWSTITLATVTTNPATNIEAMTASLNGILTADGGEACACGFEWGESEAELVHATPTQSKVTGESFSRSIQGLRAGRKYYFRALATNSA